MTQHNANPHPAMSVLRSEWLFSLHHLKIGFSRLQKVGAAPIGWRGIYPVDGGHFEGPRLRGKVLPNGADWVTRRSDRATLLDVRLGLLTDDGATIAMSYTGLFKFADTAAERYRQGEPVTMPNPMSGRRRDSRPAISAMSGSTASLVSPTAVHVARYRPMKCSR